jgi:hypothetical protein
VHRGHAHVHSRKGPGINAKAGQWPEGQLGPTTCHRLDPEAISLDKIGAAFDERTTKEGHDGGDLDGHEILEGQVYGFAELERVDRGLAPLGPLG